MRVLLVTHRYPPDGVGGVEMYVERLQEALRARGDTVEVLTRTPRHLPRRPQLVRAAGALRISGSGVRLRQFLVGHEAVEQAFSTALEQVRPDIVHVNHLIGLSPRIVALASQSGARVVFSLHDFYAACPLVHLVKTSGELCCGPAGGEECAATCFADEGLQASRWKIRFEYFSELLRVVDRVVASSLALADRAREIAPACRIEVVPLGVARTAKAAPPVASAPLTLAHLGTPSRHKGVFRVVEALGVAGLPSVQFRVHGRTHSAAERRELERAAAAVPGLELVMSGEFARGALPGLLDGVHAVVAVSEVPEGFPLAPREALAAGVPVVASAIGGMAEVVEHEVDGLVVLPRNTSALAAALARLVQEAGLCERLRAGAYATRVQTLEEHVTAMRELYADVLRQAESEDMSELETLHNRALASGFASRR